MLVRLAQLVPEKISKTGSKPVPSGITSIKISSLEPLTTLNQTSSVFVPVQATGFEPVAPAKVAEIGLHVGVATVKKEVSQLSLSGPAKPLTIR